MIKINRPLTFLYPIVALALSLSALNSCVGTVEDKNPKTTLGASAPEVPLKFDGVYEAVPIAPDKIEVFFYPSSGQPLNIIYSVNYDGSPIPLTFPATTLTPDYRGLLSVTVSGLTINTTYSFTVQARDTSTGRVSTNNIVASASTFSNITCDFNGISNIFNISGDDGRNALRVEWPEARREGSDFSKRPIDPDQYEIIAVNANNLTPAAFDDSFFSEPDRKVSIVDGKKISHQINGLQPGTEYLIRVRCIHKEFNDNSGNKNYLRERNSKYLSGTTLSDDLSSIQVDLTDFSVEPAEGAAGLNTFVVNWGAAVGAFSEYRIYYRNRASIDSGSPDWNGYKNTRNSTCDGEDGGSSNPGWYCKKVPYTDTDVILADLDAVANYDVIGVICLTLDCGTDENQEPGGEFIQYETNSPYVTYPGPASFSGITSIDQPKSIFDLGTLYLNFTPPDLNTGAADGILVELKEREPYTTPVILNHPNLSISEQGYPPSFNVTVSNFDYSQDNVVAINGIERGGAQYCFSLLPFVYDSEADNGVNIDRNGEVIRCATLDYTPPTSVEFSGINISGSVKNYQTNSITLTWNTPARGQYDRYVVFLRDKSIPGPFSFSEATDPDHVNYSNYYRYEVNMNANSYFIGFLPDGTYDIGMLTYFGVIDGYSEFNGEILEFDTSEE